MQADCTKRDVSLPLLPSKWERAVDIGNAEEVSDVSAASDQRSKMTILALLLAVFLSDATDAMPMAYFPDAATGWGFSESMVGIVLAAGYVPAVVGGSLAAAMSQRMGHSRVITMGLAMDAVSSATLITAPPVALQCGVWAAFGLSVVARLLWGFGSVMVNVSSIATAGNVYNEQRSFVIGTISAANGIAYTFGPLVGAMVYRGTGFNGVCLWGTAVLTVFLVPIFWAVSSCEKEAIRQIELDRPSGMIEMAVSPSIMTTLLAVLLSGIGFTAIDAALELELAHIDAAGVHDSVYFAGWLLGALSLCNAAFSPIIGILVSNRRLEAGTAIHISSWLMAIGAGAAGASVLVDISYFLHVGLLALAFGIYGIGSALVMVPAVEFMASSGPCRDLDIIAALMLTAMNCGTIVGACLGPFCAERLGFSAMLLVLAGAAASTAFSRCVIGWKYPGNMQDLIGKSPFSSLRTSPCLLPSVNCLEDPPIMDLMQSAISNHDQAIIEQNDTGTCTCSKHDPFPTTILNVVRMSVFLSASVDAMPMAYFPDAASHWGLSESMIGSAMGAGYLPFMLGGSLATATSRCLGHRWAISAGLLASALSMILMSQAPIFVVPCGSKLTVILSIAVRLLQGFSMSVVTVSSIAVAGNVSKSDSSWAIGSVNAGNELAYTTGPFAGAALYSVLGYTGVCLVGGFTLLTGAVLACLTLPNKGEVGEQASMFHMAKHAPVAAILVAVTLVGIGFGAIDTTIDLEMAQIALTAEQQGQSVAYAGLLLGILSLCSAVVSPFVGAWASPHRAGSCLVIKTAPWLLSASSALAGASVSVPVSYNFHTLFFAVAFGLWGIGGAMVVVPATELMASVAGVHDLEAAAALMLAALNTGTFAGSSLGPLLAEYIGFASLCGVLMVCAMTSSLHLLLSTHGVGSMPVQSRQPVQLLFQAAGAPCTTRITLSGGSRLSLM